MALKDTCKTMRTLLEGIQADLDKAEAGNKAAAQRVRTDSIKFEKVAKIYRKESIKADKSGAMKKAKVAAKKKNVTSSKEKAEPAPAKTRPVPAKKPTPAKKVPTAKKKPTAKLPRAGAGKKKK